MDFGNFQELMQKIQTTAKILTATAGGAADATVVVREASSSLTAAAAASVLPIGEAAMDMEVEEKEGDRKVPANNDDKQQQQEDDVVHGTSLATEEDWDRKPAAAAGNTSLKTSSPRSAYSEKDNDAAAAAVVPPHQIVTEKGLELFLRKGKYNLKNTINERVFGENLYRLVEHAHRHGFAKENLCWSEDGTQLCFPNKEQFLTNILTHCEGGGFRNFDSFRKNLCNHGFTTIHNDRKDPNGAAAFQHPHFQRGNPEAAKEHIIHRNATGGGGAAAKKKKRPAKSITAERGSSLVVASKRDPHPSSSTKRIKLLDASRPARPKLCVDVTALAKQLQDSPSWKRYNAKDGVRRDDSCCQCDGRRDQNGSLLLCCNFCQQVQHWDCLVETYNIDHKPMKEEGEDEDDDVFMCQDCLETAMGHVAETKVVTKPYSRDTIEALPFKLSMEGCPAYDLSANSIFGSELFRLLEDASTQGFEFIVSWREDGSSFEIHHRPLFTEWIMNKPFTIGGFHTIGTRLREYGFVRVYMIVDGIDDRGWTHPYLDLERPEVASQICKMSKMTPAEKAEYKEWKDGHDDYKSKRETVAKVEVSVPEIMKMIDEGGFGSMGRYDGSAHKDMCSICNDGGKLLLCDCCNRVNHLSCLQEFFGVQNPGPDDDFLCYDCLNKTVPKAASTPFSPSKMKSPPRQRVEEVTKSPLKQKEVLSITTSQKKNGLSRPTKEQLERYCLRDVKIGFGTSLYNLLQDAERLGISDLISWSESGKSFVIYDRERFLMQVVRKLASPNAKWIDFTSTLCHHSVHRHRDGDGSNYEYMSDLLIRGKPDLAASVESNKGMARNRPSPMKIRQPKHNGKHSSSGKKEKNAPDKKKPAPMSKPTRIYGDDELDPIQAVKRLSVKKFNLDFHKDFPILLYALLEEAARHDDEYNGTGLAEILRWQSNGSAFKVCRPDLMEELIGKCTSGSCPVGERYDNFSEILTRFEFVRTKRGIEERWQNDLFQKGELDAVEWLQAVAPPKHKDYNHFVEAVEAIQDQPFLERLHFTLSHATDFDIAHILSWEEKGRSLKIHDTEEFEEKILPHLSRQGSYISFTSALNRYNFSNRRAVLGKGSFHHPMFAKGKPGQITKIEPKY